MAASGVRRALLQVSSSPCRILFGRSSSSSSSSASKICKSNVSSSFGCSRPRLTFSRLPVELSGGVVSLVPLHSVTASALLTCLLSLTNQTWGCLSEGFGTTL